MQRRHLFPLLVAVLCLACSRAAESDIDSCNAKLPDNSETQCADFEEFAACQFKQYIQNPVFAAFITCKEAAGADLCKKQPDIMYADCCSDCKREEGNTLPLGVTVDTCQDAPKNFLPDILELKMTCQRIQELFGCASDVTSFGLVKTELARGCRKYWYDKCKKNLSAEDLSTMWSACSGVVADSQPSPAVPRAHATSALAVAACAAVGVLGAVHA